MESDPSPVSQAILDHLARTKGWALFLCILLWIAAAIMALAGISFFVMMYSNSAFSEGFNSVGTFGMGVLFKIMPFLYFIYAALCVSPALRLGKYSTRIGALLAQPTDDRLADALDQQRGFWKSTGIAIIISMVLYFGLIGVGMFSAIAATRV
jgi:hypothetical protein